MYALKMIELQLQKMLHLQTVSSSAICYGSRLGCTIWMQCAAPIVKEFFAFQFIFGKCAVIIIRE